MDALPPLTLFVKAGCPWCSDASRYLDEHEYEYKAVNVSLDRAGYKELQRVSGQTYAPTLLVGDPAAGLVLPDFGVPELEEFLEKHGLLQ